MNNNLEPKSDNGEGKSRAKVFWKHIGFVAIALGLAVITVFVLNLNV